MWQFQKSAKTANSEKLYVGEYRAIRVGKSRDGKTISKDISKAEVRNNLRQACSEGNRTKPVPEDASGLLAAAEEHYIIRACDHSMRTVTLKFTSKGGQAPNASQAALQANSSSSAAYGAGFVNLADINPHNV